MSQSIPASPLKPTVSPEMAMCFASSQPDIFSEIREVGGTKGAVAHSFWSEFYNCHPFDYVRDVEYDEPDNQSINQGRFHTMTGYVLKNQMTPSDVDLFATLTSLCLKHDLTYGMLHTCTLDSMGHRFFHESQEMDHACFVMDEMLAPCIPKWRAMGYEVIVTADYKQDKRGHHGGAGKAQQDFALYYFSEANGPDGDTLLDQLQLAPTILQRSVADIPSSMTAKPFLS